MAWRWSLTLACWSSLLVVVTGICAPGWTTYTPPNQVANCYSVQTMNASWAEARQWCISAGGELASILSVQENTQITSLIMAAGLRSAAWIGLNDRLMEDHYQWSDNATHGQTLHFTNWRSGEPNNLVDEDCADMDSTGKWNDASCSTSMPFVCKKNVAAPIPPTVSPTSTLDNTSMECGGWFKMEGFCYQYFSVASTFDVAQNSCFQHGATLLDVLSPKELAYGKGFVYAERKIVKSFYIGLNDRLDEGVFVWADGTLTGHSLNKSLTLWGRGEPNDNRHLEDCVEWQQWPSNKWNDISCSTKRPYICKRPTSPTGKWTSLPSPVRTSCPNGYTNFTHPVNGARYCYRAMGRIAQWRTSWNGARSACRRIGSNFDLASIHDHYEMAIILKVINKAYSIYRTRVYWIGLNDQSREGGYVNSDGTPTDYINWGYGQPNNLQGKQDCVQIYSYRGQWNDDLCSNHQSYICKLVLSPPTAKKGTPTVTDKYCQQGWYQYGSYCYQAHVNSASGDYVSHSKAVAMCKVLKANLTSVHSVAEHAFIMSLVGLKNASGRVHIGINDLAREGEFQWSDHTLVTYTNWGYNQPNNWRGRQDCVELDHTSGYWNDISCSALRGYVCKRIRDQSNKPTVLQTNCKNGWMGYNKYCYMAVSNKSTTFAMAEAACQQYRNKNNLQAHLATVRSRYDNFFLLSMATQTTPYPRSYWIGLSDRSQEGVYTWTSQLPITYSKWAGHQPDDWKHSEDCVEFRTWSAQWNDRMCNTSLPYICMMPDENQVTPPPTPSSTKGNAQATCPTGWVKHKTYCYGMFGNINSATMQMTSPIVSPMTWVNARAQCAAMGTGADLVSIHSQDVEDFLTNQTVTQKTGWYSFWTGLNDRNQEGGYTWSDGSGLGYTAWAVQEPNDWKGSEDCVELLLNKSRVGWRYRWNDQSCNSRRPFICSLPAGNAFTPPTSAPSYIVPAGKTKMVCPQGWISTDTYCYLVVSDKIATWTNAGLKCKAQAQSLHTFSGVSITPTLASIHSPSEHIALAKELSKITPPSNNSWSGFWIGLQDRQKENNFTWSDKSATDYTAWGQWQPDNWHNQEDCGTMLYNQGYVWNDALCANTLPYICGFSRIINSSALLPTKPSPISQLQCFPDWVKWGSSCYKTFSTNRMDWENAFTNCSLAKGDLVVINSKAEDIFVQSQMISGTAYYWMGLSDLDRENYWRWVSGQRVTYSNWGPYQPNNQQGSEDCVAVHSEDDKWYDRDCYEPHAYVCEVPVVNMNYTSGSTFHRSSKAGVVAGAVVGTLFGIVIIGLIVFMVRRRSSRPSSYSPSGLAVNSADDDDDALLGEE